MIGAEIKGSGIYLPLKIVQNEELESLLGLEKGSIESKTGIMERRWSNDKETVEYMAAEATSQAVKEAKVDRVDRIIIARDLIATKRGYSIGLPIMSKLNAEGIDIDECSSIDISNYCPGFVHALNIAQLLVQSEQCENVAVVASTDYTDVINTDSEFNSEFKQRFDSRNRLISQYSLNYPEGQYQSPSLNAFLWGCGAGSLIVGKSNKNRIIGFRSRSSQKAKFNSYGVGETKNGKSFASLDGKSIYRFAIGEIPQEITKFIKRYSLNPQEVILIPHQPNPRILDKLMPFGQLR